MANYDLDKMDLDELKKLQKVVNKAVEDFHERKRREALAAAEKAAAELGFSLGELTSGQKASKKTKTGLPPKYRNPQNPDQSWSGRGRRPQWVVEATENGIDIEEFRIDRAA
ncbi:DNA-binding protein H-NS [Limimaricola variabilis]|uniref:DNA-binding protein H-NS n=1 Tax=Limimaricola variabilis TaxID=1492771 RepID=A0ABR6HTN4_9RHOB|nr:H-NS histone family protein [Limimaricola variabilis]MBB3713729.1 DNA-binding protein H-NS [Limimaricola variabilis]